MLEHGKGQVLAERLADPLRPTFCGLPLYYWLYGVSTME